ncbi:MAG: hypothetical protein ACR2NR_18690 [Solirubrobacteraceae bacterium]
MAVELVMQVARSQDNRLSGTVSLTPAADPRGFSGTLELMRVLEDLVPCDGAAEPARPGPRP